jgi:hypothetical protein
MSDQFLLELIPKLRALSNDCYKNTKAARRRSDWETHGLNIGKAIAYTNVICFIEEELLERSRLMNGPITAVTRIDSELQLAKQRTWTK